MKNRLGISGGRRALPILALLAAAFGVGTGLQRLGTAAHAETSAGTRENIRLTEAATMAVEDWARAVASGNPETIRNFLAPEFQILRSDGRGYDRAGYLAGGRSKIDSIIGVRDVIATEYGNHIVVRYVISLKGSADGKTLQSVAPRLTVFRRDRDRWLVVAHANFANLKK